MIHLEATDSGIRARDHANVEVSVEAREWVVTDEEATLSRPTDAVVAGAAGELRLPPGFVLVEDRDVDRTFELGNDTGPLELSSGRYLLDLGASLKTYVAFSGPATVEKTGDFEHLIVRFPGRRSVTLGFRSRHEQPADAITVEPTPAGIATALSHLHSAMKTTGPERSFPTLRGHPPRVEVGETTTVPEAIETGTDHTGIEVVAPPSVDHLYVLAPLSYYLQASVTVGDVEAPRLRAPAAGLDRRLPDLPELQAETAGLLRHVLYLDTLVRNVGPHGTELAELSVLETLPLSPERAYEADPPRRLATYLDVSREALSDHVPEWHLSMYVEPDPERVRSLPFLLDRMSLVFLPETTDLTGKELLEQSLDDFYRFGNSVADVDVVNPMLQDGRIHGWLADGIPIDVFKAVHAGFENRLDYLEDGGDGMDVAVVLNDEEMDSEHGEVARIYRERAADLPMSVTVHRFLDRDELAAVFEADNDFVHFIGHCEQAGLRCPDGTLAVADVEESNTQTFFLNACGSYHEGMELLRKGSVAGAVTFREVLDEQAGKVGTAFARLLVEGFSFARAMQLARRRIMTGKNYAIVGDGTHRLTQSRSLNPFVFHLRGGPDRYELSVDSYSTWSVGGAYYVNLDADGPGLRLAGNQATFELMPAELVEFLERTSEPVIHDGDLRWSTEVAADLSE
ncbi:MAG: hypothetical protein V5A33_04845 [Halobacteriales archaeon]